MLSSCLAKALLKPCSCFARVRRCFAHAFLTHALLIHPVLSSCFAYALLMQTDAFPDALLTHALLMHTDALLHALLMLYSCMPMLCSCLAHAPLMHANAFLMPYTHAVLMHS